MKRVDNLSGAARQQSILILDNGLEVTLQLVYLPAPQRWMLNVSYQDFTVNGIILTLHPNFLRQWRRKLPFGLACAAQDGVDPVYATDFDGGAASRCSLYLLDAADIAFVEDTVIGHPA